MPSAVFIGAGEYSGSGFVVNESGLVVTNKHVVEGLDLVWVMFVSGERYVGKVVQEEEDVDLAYVQIDSDRIFTPLPIGNSEALRVGERVMTIGFPLKNWKPDDTNASVTAGIVSSLRFGLIQIDAAINGGNSGGPLLNAAGEVVGVVESSATIDSWGLEVQGLHFAIPINDAKHVVE